MLEFSQIVGMVVLAVMAAVFHFLQEGALRALPQSPVLWSGLGKANTWIAEKLHTSTQTVLRVEIGALFASGFALMQIGEWAAADACWVLLGIVLISKAVAWRGVDGQKGIPVFTRFLAAICALALSALLIAITQLRKPEDEPWSNLQKPWTNKTRKIATQARTFNVSGEYITNGIVVYGLGLWNIQEDAVYPVGIETYLRLGNDAPVSEMVDSIGLEIQTASGTWEPLETMDNGDFYYGQYPKLSPLDLKLLKSELLNRNLQPGDHAGGWMFFDYPKSAQIAPPNFALYAQHVVRPDKRLNPQDEIIFEGGNLDWEAKVPPYTPHFRARIVDMRGETSTVPVLMSTIRWSDQTVSLVIKGPEQDLKTHSIKFLRLQ